MLCDIIIPVWNQPAFTKDCIGSIIKYTDMAYGIIIIDNASDEDTKKCLEGLKASNVPEITLVRNEKNLGFVKAVNQGISASSAPNLCVLNNDTIVTDGWLKEMVEVLNKEKDIGIVNPSSNNLGQRPLKGEPIELYAHSLKRERGRYVELGAAIGFCMLIKRQVIDRIGLFDEIYGMGNFEDTDFSRRAVKEGYRCVRACGAYVYHREGSSFNKVKTFEYDFRRNKEIYEFRWGKPKRMAYILDFYDDNILRRLKAESMNLARGGNWIWYFSKDPIDVPRHSNISFIRLDGKWFYLKAIFGILKKKKKFDEIFVGSERLHAILDRMRFLHKSKVNYY